MNTETNGQEPTTEQQQGEQTFTADYVAKIRNEAAGYRVELKELKQQFEALKPLAEKAQKLEEAQKTDAEKMAERLAAMQQELEAQKAAVDLATKQNKLTQLAIKAGIPTDAVALLNVNSFDLTDEEATVNALKVLAPAKAASGGNASNPARDSANNGQLSPKDWWAQRQGGGRGIFDMNN